jgi:hypothetical protein
MAYPSHRPLNIIRVYAHCADISTAGSYFVPSPCRGRIIKMGSILYAAITTADDVITSEINGTAITGGGWTIAFTSSAPGDVDTAVPTAANFVNEDDKIEFINSGASDTTAPVLFFADIRVGG